jgi:hypothetical protein
MQCTLLDQGNQNCKNKERFKKIGKGATFKMNDPSASFGNVRSFSWTIDEQVMVAIVFFKFHSLGLQARSDTKKNFPARVT